MPEFEIKPSNLFDSPYQPGKKDLFSFDVEELDDLISDIRLSNPSCYLLSGYRGVGKTSFIRKVEELIEHNKTVHDQDHNVVFIHESFANSDKELHLIRKLIRALFRTLQTSVAYTGLNETKTTKDDEEKERERDRVKEFIELDTLLTILHKRTFQEVSVMTGEKQANETVFKSELNISWIDALNVLAPGVLLLLNSFGAIKAFIENFSEGFQSAVSISSFIWLLVGFFKLSKISSRSRTEEKSLYTKSLYDEEIAGHHLFNLLQMLQRQGLRLVFVLDELDKVEDDHVDNLINEMKPYLVSGYASFIIVSGQKLFYKYYVAQGKDDSVLSSLFSKVIHISLATPSKLRFIFNNVIVADIDQSSDSEKAALEQLVDYFILKSRLVPRRFISLLRQNIVYREGTRAFLTSNGAPSNHHLSTKLIDIIHGVDNTYILPDGHDKAIRDYMVSSLYIETFTRYFNYVKGQG